MAKLGLPFLMCQLELVFVPVCDFLSVVVFVSVFVFAFEKVESAFFSVPGLCVCFVFVYLRRGVCLDKVGSAFPIVPA